jgi:DNA polymerase-3 subunit delta'
MAFAHILGQDNAIAVLQHALRADRVPHAYIFAGYDGVGKKLTALTLAKAINCLHAADDSCDQCLSCQKIEAGNHPDVRIIEPDGQFIKIDQIRQVQKDATYKPFEGRRKVYIIDQAEALRPEAANALLKTLEEPSEDCLLILVTANVYALLPTVISRCQFVRFVALGVETLTQFLVQTRHYAPEQARLLASLAEGCPGRALAMDAEATLAKRENIEHLLQTLSSGLQDVRVIFRQVETLMQEKSAVQELLDILLVWYRDMYLLRNQGDPSFVANADAVERLQQAAAQVSARQIERLFETVYRTKLDILRNANLQLALEVMFIALTEVYNDRNRWREIPNHRQSV